REEQHLPGEYCHDDFDSEPPFDPELEAAMEAEFEREMASEKPIADELWRVDEDCRQFAARGPGWPYQHHRSAQVSPSSRTNSSSIEYRSQSGTNDAMATPQR
ncbi:hypothetical protein, partial [Pseudomonas sp. 313]